MSNVLASSSLSPMVKASFLTHSKMNGLRMKISAKVKMTMNTPYVTILKIKKITEEIISRGSVMGAKMIANG